MNRSPSFIWDGEPGQELHTRFSVVDGVPTVRALAIRRKGGEWVTLGRDLVPEFGVITGVRRTGHGLDHEHRWDVFWDAPLNHHDEVRRSQAAFHADRLEVKADGARLEVSFPGLSMQPFSGGLRFTVYRGTNLLRIEAVASTDEPLGRLYYPGKEDPPVGRTILSDRPGESDRIVRPTFLPG